MIHRLGIYKADGEITRVVGTRGKGESLVPPYTRVSVPLVRSRVVATSDGSVDDGGMVSESTR